MGDPNMADGSVPPAMGGDKDARTMAMLAHLLGILIGFLGPLLIWLLKKDQSAFVESQSKEALNFQLTLLIGYVISGVTSCILIGWVLLPIVWLTGLIFGIIGGMQANNGVEYRYPFNIRMIK
jgi:uncharacterized protein